MFIPRYVLTKRKESDNSVNANKCVSLHVFNIVNYIAISLDILLSFNKKMVWHHTVFEWLKCDARIAGWKFILSFDCEFYDFILAFDVFFSSFACCEYASKFIVYSVCVMRTMRFPYFCNKSKKKASYQIFSNLLYKNVFFPQMYLARAEQQRSLGLSGKFSERPSVKSSPTYYFVQLLTFCAIAFPKCNIDCVRLLRWGQVRSPKNYFEYLIFWALHFAFQLFI